MINIDLLNLAKSLSLPETRGQVILNYKRLSDAHNERKKRMKSKYHFENGETYKYDSEAFERFYKEYDAVMRGIPSFLKSDLLRKWVKAHGTRIPKAEIKKGSFIAVFKRDTGVLSFFVFAAKIDERGAWVNDEGLSILLLRDEIDNYRTFICPTGIFLSQEGFGSATNPLVPRTIEDAERFCAEVTE